MAALGFCKLEVIGLGSQSGNRGSHTFTPIARVLVWVGLVGRKPEKLAELVDTVGDVYSENSHIWG